MKQKRVIPRPKTKQYRRTFLRQWRESKNMTLEAAAEALDMTHASLSRIERGLQPYSQPILEALADLYGTDVPNLLMRDPSDPNAMWSLWDQAKEGERQEIEKFAQFLKSGAK